MKDFVSLDRIKYRRWWAVYIADMKHLRTSSDPEDRKIWNAFMAGDFSCQKSDIPGTSIGRDHAGEQENRTIKNRGGITGITTNENARTRHFLIAPILKSLSEEMLKLGGASSSVPKCHHQLNKAYTKRQNLRISSLLKVFEKHLTFSAVEVPFLNMITGQVFPDEVFKSTISFETLGKTMYQIDVIERLKAESTKAILHPLHKANLRTCKYANKKRTMKVYDKVVELRGNCNLFARCALMQKQRDINMKEVVGDHELTIVPRALFNVDGSLLDGAKNKSDAVSCK